MDSAEPSPYPRYPLFLPLNPQIITENTFFLSSSPPAPLAHTCSVKLARLASQPFGGITRLIWFFAECGIIAGSPWEFETQDFTK